MVIRLQPLRPFKRTGVAHWRPDPFRKALVPEHKSPRVGDGENLPEARIWSAHTGCQVLPHILQG